MNTPTESLLHKVRRLYTELFLVTLHNRIDSFHSFLHLDGHLEIGKVLHELIDEIVKDVSHNYSPEDYKDMKFLDSGTTTRHVQPDHNLYRSPSMASMTLNGLSVFLKKQKAEEYNPHMADKLQRVVWDHVHSAHRFARLGDGNTAKLHADIACNAIKALSHYMSSEDYNIFFNEISEQLQSTGVDTTSSQNS